MSTENHHNQNNLEAIKAQQQSGNTTAAFEIMVTPLHEALYKRQSFDLLDELPVADRTTLAFDYIRNQVEAGGFIQLIQNGYVSLLLTTIEGFQELGIEVDMISVLDDVLKVYVLNVDTLSKETSVDEFARLYSEFREFEELEKRFDAAKEATMNVLIDNCLDVNK